MQECHIISLPSQRVIASFSSFSKVRVTSRKSIQNSWGKRIQYYHATVLYSKYTNRENKEIHEQENYIYWPVDILS